MSVAGGFHSADFGRARHYFKPEPAKLSPFGGASAEESVLR